MADLRLEKEWARQLGPVSAPESLWDRINRQQGPPRCRRASMEWVFWPVAAAMVVLAIFGILRARNAHYDPERFTDEELALRATTSGFDFRSDNFEDTRAWVKGRANIDIDLPPGHAEADRSAVRMLGVRMVDLRGLPIAAIDYRVGDEMATLFVSGKRAGLTGDMGVSNHMYTRRRLVSWNMRNETYTIAYRSARNPHGACLLCHATSPG
jgi:hypothetical protein